MLRLAGLLATVLLLGVANAEGAKDIPLKDCTSARVLVALDYGEHMRETSSSPALLENLGKVKALVARYSGKGKPGQPMIEYLSAEDAGEFATLSAQSLTIRFNQLAESRLQRDAQMLMRMKDLAERDRTTGVSITLESDPDLKPYSYLAAMRAAVSGHERSTPPNKLECSLDLALDNDAGSAIRELSDKLQTSPEVAELLSLRAKYQVPDGADFKPGALTRTEVARLPVLKAAVGAMMRGQDTYLGDISALRYFSEAGLLQYDWLRANILQFGATTDVGRYDKADAARYDALSPHLQKIVNIWRHMDADYPSKGTKDAQMVVDSLKALSGK